MLSPLVLRPFRFTVLLAVVMLAWCATARGADAPRDLREVRKAGALKWGGDASGGAPYQFMDPKDPTKLVGFEVDIARELGKRLGVRDQFTQTDWGTLIIALNRGDFEIAMSGIEVTEERKGSVNFTRPYYVYTEQLVVHAKNTTIHGIDDCTGRKVGTLNNTAAERILRARPGIEVVAYDDNVRPYDDLVIGRLDAVLLDLPLAVYHGKPRPELRFAGDPFGEGFYAIAVRKASPELLAALDAALTEMIRDGSLRQILEKWGLWNRAQDKLAETRPANVPSSSLGRTLLDFAPLFLRGTWMTIKISVLAMILASVLGLTLALMRVYGSALLRGPALLYVEFMRGTPLLIQLLFIYYGLPQIPVVGMKLDAFAAAIIGVGLNYAAYSAEIYRAGLMSVPRTQTEAALALGLTRRQAVRFVVLPQALRLVVPPITNDFVALFKDSSIVMILGLSELTFTFRSASIATGHYLEFAIITALIYFGLAYPLARLARRLEKRIHPHHDFDTQPL